MPERREGEQLPMIDVTEPFLTMTQVDFLVFMSRQAEDKYIKVDFAKLGDAKREELESLLKRGWFKTAGIYATGEEIKQHPQFFSLDGIETFPKD